MQQPGAAMIRQKVIIITGASSGIGKQTAIDLAKRGAKLGLIARNQAHLGSALQAVQTDSPHSMMALCNVCDNAQVQQAITRIIDHFGRVDVLINNAGSGKYLPFENQTIDEVREQMDVNYFGAVYCIKAVLPQMKKQRSGHIINVSSVAGRTGFPNISAYAASKFAVAGLSESLFYEFEDLGINVSAVYPGAVNTNFFDDESWKNFPHKKRHARMLQPSDVSQVIIQTIKKPKLEVFISWKSRMKIVAKHVLPGMYCEQVRKLLR